ncbi:hypothetical protein GLOIN_2v1569052, partial [Rhizophagus irregularis DAOM 181602=DAOM 197198]
LLYNLLVWYRHSCQLLLVSLLLMQPSDLNCVKDVNITHPTCDRTEVFKYRDEIFRLKKNLPNEKYLPDGIN